MSETEKEASVHEVELKTFTRWANCFLAERKIQIDCITTGFTDGVALCHLLEVLSHRKIYQTYVLKN